MPSLKCMIVDDEPLPLELLADYINKTPFLELVGSFTNPLEALVALKHQPVDLIFLDIQMPELNGIQFTQLVGEKPKIIFTTAYTNYALQGYELNVVDYLLKPIPFDRFLKAATRALQSLQPAADQPADTGTQTGAGAELIFVKSGYKTIKIVLSEILFLESLKEYVAIHKSAEKILTLESMKKMEELLPAHLFVRVHKSYIVNIKHIDSIERNRIFMGKTVIPIGDTYRNTFFSLLEKGGYPH